MCPQKEAPTAANATTTTNARHLAGRRAAVRAGSPGAAPRALAMPTAVMRPASATSLRRWRRTPPSRRQTLRSAQLALRLTSLVRKSVLEDLQTLEGVDERRGVER